MDPKLLLTPPDTERCDHLSEIPVAKMLAETNPDKPIDAQPTHPVGWAANFCNHPVQAKAAAISRPHSPKPSHQYRFTSYNPRDKH